MAAQVVWPALAWSTGAWAQTRSVCVRLHDANRYRQWLPAAEVRSPVPNTASLLTADISTARPVSQASASGEMANSTTSQDTF